jgi:hypothetical protein
MCHQQARIGRACYRFVEAVQNNKCVEPLDGAIETETDAICDVERKCVYIIVESWNI